MMIQGLSEENRFLTCLWPSNTLSLSRKSQTWKFREIYIKLHGLVVQMSFILRFWDCLQGRIFWFDHTIHVEATLFAHQQSWQPKPPAFLHYVLLWVRPCLGNHGNEKELLFQLKSISGLNHVATESPRWRLRHVASLNHVMSEEPLSHQMGAVAEDASHVNWCPLIDTLLEKCQNVSEPCPWSSAVPIEELPLFLDELPAQCLARNRSWKPLGSPAETPRRNDFNDSWSIL